MLELVRIGSGELELLPITLFATAADAGLFKVASALASGAALLVPGVLSAQLLPMMAHARGHGQGEAEFRFVATTTWLVMLGAPLVAFGFVHASTLIPWLYGSAYAPAGAVFAALLVARTASVIALGTEHASSRPLASACAPNIPATSSTISPSSASLLNPITHWKSTGTIT